MHQDDIGYDICKADGQNFYIVGYANNSPNVLFTIKINQYGDTIWTRTISDSNGRSIRALAVVSSGDGGCVLTGSWDSAFTIKYDLSGNVIWRKFYGGNNVQCYDILRAPDNGYIGCGHVFFDGYIFRIDSEGELNWQRTFSSMGVRFYSSIINGIDDNTILAGSFSEAPNLPAKALFNKIDTIGNILIENKYQIRGTSTSITSITSNNTHYFATGSYIINGQNYRVHVSKLNLKGEITDSIVLNAAWNEYEPRICSIEPNRFVFASVKDTVTPNPSFVLLRILDSSLNILTQKSFSWTNGLSINSISPEINGDILFVGWSMDPTPIRANVYALRTDSILNAPPPIGIINYTNSSHASYRLYPVYPNPFNPVTMIKYDIPAGNIVNLKVYDLLGREVFSSTEYKTAGSYEVRFDGTNLASGLYFYSIDAGNYRDTKKMVLLK